MISSCCDAKIRIQNNKDPDTGFYSNHWVCESCDEKTNPVQSAAEREEQIQRMLDREAEIMDKHIEKEIKAIKEAYNKATGHSHNGDPYNPNSISSHEKDQNGRVTQKGIKIDLSKCPIKVPGVYGLSEEFKGLKGFPKETDEFKTQILGSFPNELEDRLSNQCKANDQWQIKKIKETDPNDFNGFSDWVRQTDPDTPVLTKKEKPKIMTGAKLRLTIDGKEVEYDGIVSYDTKEGK